MGREEKREGGAGREVRQGGRLREGKEQQVDCSVINITMVRHLCWRGPREMVAKVSSIGAATCLALCLAASASLVVSVERKLIMSPDSDEL